MFDAPAPEPDWSDRAAVVDYIVDSLHPYAGSVRFDDDQMRVLSGASSTGRGTSDPARRTTGSSKAASRCVLGWPRSPCRRSFFTAPNPLFPLAHGKALANAILGARFLPLDGVGHEFPPREVWDQVVDAVIAHTTER